ncbi:MAG: redoxin domain-containing protein [Candidatus Acidiferrales bacterium]
MSLRWTSAVLIFLLAAPALAEDKKEKPQKEEYAIYLRTDLELEWKRPPGEPVELKIKKLDKNSAAARAGYQKGDEIVAIGGEAPGERSLAEFLSLAEAEATFRVRRKKGELELPPLFVAGPMLESPAERFKPGKRAPAIKIKVPEQGTKDALELVAGKVVLVNFWATWCKPCMEEMPMLVRLYEQLRPQGLTVIGVNVDSDVDAAKKWLNQNPLPFPSVFTGGFGAEIPLNYEVRSIPTNVLVDRERFVVQVSVGFGGASERRMRQALETVLEAQQPILSLCRK